MRYWITKEEFDKCDDVLYRAYVFNFQEDLWNYVYTARELDECTPASQQLFNLFRINRSMFNAYVKAPSQQKIDSHLRVIDTRLTSIKQTLENLEPLPTFKGYIFLESVNRLLEEFGE
ncbi:MAG: hypothetical protein ACW99Q_08935 [Candidatus Kariarchaeaceae archaeon]|jgi:hypothetical protein